MNATFRVLMVVWALEALPSTAAAQLAPGTVAAADATTRWSNAEYRHDQARNWLREFRRLDDQIPTLSPAEEAWLRVEVDDELARTKRYTPRASAAMDSREYQTRIAKPAVQSIVATLEQLADGSRMSSQREAHLWAQVAAEVMDVQLWQAIDQLVQKKTVNSEINGIKSFYFANHVMWAQGILVGFVIPSMAR